MSEQELGSQLLQGLRQLQKNLELLRATHAVRGLDTNAPYTKNTEDLLKVEYANQSLKGLEL